MDRSRLTIPADTDAISPEWMTAALSRHFPGAEVSGIELVLRDDGTNRRARLGLSYSAGSGPATVFVKAADPAHARLNAKTGGLFNEARLFLSEVALPLDHPGVYLSLVDEQGLDFLLVMEDMVARGADPRDSTRPLTVEQATHGVRALARLHSAYWGDRLDACGALAWVDPLVAWTGMARGIDIGLKRAADLVPSAVLDMSGEMIERHHWARYLSTLSQGPATLLHGDAHIGNTYVLPDHDVGFLDWQVLRRGNQSLDLGYFLQGALTVEARRESDEAIVAAYHEALELSADERPTRDDVWLRYRASVAHGLALWLATAASDTWQRPAVSLALAERYATAWVDLESDLAIDLLMARV